MIASAIYALALLGPLNQVVLADPVGWRYRQNPYQQHTYQRYAPRADPILETLVVSEQPQPQTVAKQQAPARPNDHYEGYRTVVIPTGQSVEEYNRMKTYLAPAVTAPVQTTSNMIAMERPALMPSIPVSEATVEQQREGPMQATRQYIAETPVQQQQKWDMPAHQTAYQPVVEVEDPAMYVAQPQYIPQQPAAHRQFQQEPAHQNPIVAAMPTYQHGTMMQDEYSRVHAFDATNEAEAFCQGFDPSMMPASDNAFKDPSSPIHYLTCIGKGQARRMGCPRYTVFNEFVKRCVERQYGDDRCGPCENGGRCMQEKDGNYQCDCPMNYVGKRCEEFVNPCARQPCGSGLCFNISTSPGYICQCSDHVFNDNCRDNVINRCGSIGNKQFYADSGNLFVHCSLDGLAFVKRCPSGMVFNEAKETCTFPPAWVRQPSQLVASADLNRRNQQLPKTSNQRRRRNVDWQWYQ